MSPRRPTPPERCTQPVATLPHDGRVIWIERAPHGTTGKPLVRPITRARWRSPNGCMHPSGGHWVLPSECGAYLQDEHIVAWEEWDGRYE